LNTSPPLQAQPLPDGDIETAPPPQAIPTDGTFPYDGGPRNPPPMPKASPAPIGAPGAAVPDGRSVSVPGKPRYAYPAYGETLKVAPRPKDRGNVYLIRADRL
jgi:hypothetical protein